VFLSHFGPDQSCASAGNVLTILLDEEHLTIYTRVLSTIGFWFYFYPEPTLFIFELCLIYSETIWILELAKHNKLGTYGGRVAYLIKGDPDFIGCTSPHHHLLASLLFVSGLLIKFSKNYYFIHLFYCFVKCFLI